MQPTSPSRNIVESSFVDVETSNEDTLQVMARLRVTSTPEAVRRGVSLSIPLDVAQKSPESKETLGADIFGLQRQRREVEGAAIEPLKRRDSMKRREALLKGQEGSRRRQKWENGKLECSKNLSRLMYSYHSDNLLGNPYAQPPLPCDWEVRPTYPVHTVPYALASLWDARKAEEGRKARKAEKNPTLEKKNLGQIPKELKLKLKRSRGAKGLLQDLEEEVRQFVQKWEEAEEHNSKKESVAPDDDLDDDFVVITNTPSHSRNSSLDYVQIFQKEKLIYSSGPDEDASARFVYV